MLITSRLCRLLRSWRKQSKTTSPMRTIPPSEHAMTLIVNPFLTHHRNWQLSHFHGVNPWEEWMSACSTTLPAVLPDSHRWSTLIHPLGTKRTLTRKLSSFSQSTTLGSISIWMACPTLLHSNPRRVMLTQFRSANFKNLFQRWCNPRSILRTRRHRFVQLEI